MAFVRTSQRRRQRRRMVMLSITAVAAVAATTPEIAEEALNLIEVTYEGLPGIFDPEAAMKYMEGGAVKKMMGGGSVAKEENSGHSRGGGAAISGTKFAGVK